MNKITLALAAISLSVSACGQVSLKNPPIESMQVEKNMQSTKPLDAMSSAQEKNAMAIMDIISHMTDEYLMTGFKPLDFVKKWAGQVKGIDISGFYNLNQHPEYFKDVKLSLTTMRASEDGGWLQFDMLPGMKLTIKDLVAKFGPYEEAPDYALKGKKVFFHYIKPDFKYEAFIRAIVDENKNPIEEAQIYELLIRRDPKGYAEELRQEEIGRRK